MKGREMVGRERKGRGHLPPVNFGSGYATAGVCM